MEEQECCEGNCESYRGKLNKTAYGKDCQRWDAQTPHKHGFDEKKLKKYGLEENYCRNPDNHFEAWCYTVDGESKWERCALPPCKKHSATYVPHYPYPDPYPYSGYYEYN